VNKEDPETWAFIEKTLEHQPPPPDLEKQREMWRAIEAARPVPLWRPYIWPAAASLAISTGIVVYLALGVPAPQKDPPPLVETVVPRELDLVEPQRFVETVEPEPQVVENHEKPVKRAPAKIKETAQRVELPELLLEEADRARRAGELERAAQLYHSVAEHPAGSAYKEEALLRRARILHQLHRDDEARQVLQLAEEKYPEGELRPERVRLKAEIEAGEQ
jgi:hypothetical protein